MVELFLTFAKIGLFTFGGGYAMISIIINICVAKKKWITHDEMMNVAVIAESTPGPIAINCATYVGYKKKGIRGAIAATLGVVFPSFIIIYLISIFLNNFLEITWVVNAFKGIRVAVGLLILDAGLNMIKKMKKKVFQMAVVCCSFTAMMLINIFAWNFSSILLMLIAAIISLLVLGVQEARSGNGGDLK
ncbi:chromate transporter [Butyrivibrio sp. LC3010]|uniref:chromate transporter n=1 Tax=Butyrivibrio sp. LC3010 TaxID=1280680 RepID=UPI0003F63085|nr:chromate transporter [Butyrivibrio sp. LC3010]